jgi:hypothetical protein
MKRRDVYVTITRSDSFNEWNVRASRGGRTIREYTAQNYAQARRFASQIVMDESRGTVDKLRRRARDLRIRFEDARYVLADKWLGIK